jgi:hemerythrin-like domain-containing protein
MKATQELMNEHRGISLMLSIFQKICAIQDSEKKLDLDHVAGILEFFTVFVDRCHHGKEEDFLFPSLESLGVPREGGVLGVMLAEHTKGRRYVRFMKDGFEAFRKGDPDGAQSMVGSVRAYSELLKQHIEKEEGVLFTMADRLLSEARQEGLYIEFEKLEKERIGEGRHEEFHEFMRRLKEIYMIESATGLPDLR